MAYEKSVRLTRDTILAKLSENQIFQYYLGYTPQEGKRFKNPFRKDTNPDCYFYHNGNKVKFRDPSVRFDEDCFGIVMKKFNCSYPLALEQIAKDFGLYGWSKNTFIPETIKVEENTIKEKQRARFRVKFRKWNQEDAAYWRQYYITRETLELFNVRPIHASWVNENELPFYIYSEGDPGYAYIFPDKTVKLYFPYRDKGYKFRNNSTFIQGLNLLPDRGEDLLITKSYKDVIAMYGFGIHSIAPQSESNKFDVQLIKTLKDRFTNIYSLFDWDRAGIEAAIVARNEFGIQPLFFTKSDKCNFLGARVKIDFGYKDFTDNLKAYGMYDMLDIIRYTRSVICVRDLLHQDIVPF